MKKVTYEVESPASSCASSSSQSPNGIMKADGETVYQVTDMKVGLFQPTSLRKETSMRRVVVTGLGIVSSIGNNVQEVLNSLREAKSGIVKAD